MTKLEKFYVSSARAFNIIVDGVEYPKLILNDEFIEKYSESINDLLKEFGDKNLDICSDIKIRDNMISIIFIDGNQVCVYKKDFRGYLLNKDCLYAPNKQMIDEMNNKDTYGSKEFEDGDMFGIVENCIVDDTGIGTVGYLLITYIEDQKPVDINVIVDEESEELIKIEK